MDDYRNSDLNWNEIALKCNVSVRTIYNWRQEHNYEDNGKQYTKEALDRTIKTFLADHHESC
jgi:uncharacterized protein YjcR